MPFHCSKPSGQGCSSSHSNKPSVLWQRPAASLTASSHSFSPPSPNQPHVFWQFLEHTRCICLRALVVFSRSVVSDSATQWTASHQASQSFTIFRCLLTLISVESVMPSNHLVLCCHSYHALITWLSCFDPMAHHILITWLIMQGSRGYQDRKSTRLNSSHNA